NCRCNPATGGVATGPGGGDKEGAAAASPVPIRDAAAMAPPAMPAAAAISLRRLSSRLNLVSCAVMAARLLHGVRGSLSQLDDSLANRSGRCHRSQSRFRRDCFAPLAMTQQEGVIARSEATKQARPV